MRDCVCIGSFVQRTHLKSLKLSNRCVYLEFVYKFLYFTSSASQPVTLFYIYIFYYIHCILPCLCIHYTIYIYKYTLIVCLSLLLLFLTLILALTPSHQLLILSTYWCSVVNSPPFSFYSEIIVIIIKYPLGHSNDCRFEQASKQACKQHSISESFH